jgi:protein-disulfide isomerase
MLKVGTNGKPTLTISISLTQLLAVVAMAGILTSITLWDKNQALGQELLAAQSANKQVGAAAVAADTTTGIKGAFAPITDKDHVIGDSKAQITLVEYSDTECPFCKRFHPELQQIMADYPGKIKWAYRQFPLTIHQNAEKEAEATECVAHLGGNDAFWNFTNKIYDQTTSGGQGFSLDNLAPLAAQVGVSQDAFTACFKAGTYVSDVTEDLKSGATVGITGTPGTILVKKDGSTQLINGALPIASVKEIIDKALE